MGSHCCCSLWWQQHLKPHSSCRKGWRRSQAAAAPEAPRRSAGEGGCGQTQSAETRGFLRLLPLPPVPHFSLASQSPSLTPPHPLELAELLFFNLTQGEGQEKTNCFHLPTTQSCTYNGKTPTLKNQIGPLGTRERCLPPPGAPCGFPKPKKGSALAQWPVSISFTYSRAPAPPSTLTLQAPPLNNVFSLVNLLLVLTLHF